MKPPFVLGLEFSGTIAQVPAGSSFSVGEGVFGACNGAYAEYIVVAMESPLRRIPHGVGFQDAAVLAGTFPVAYKALVQKGEINAGDTLLVHTAGGGLGTAAVQIAAALGCRVIGTASSEEKCKLAESFGAQTCISSEEEDWHDRVLELTGGQGVDIVFDPAGKVTSSLKCLARGGKILVVGFTSTQADIEKVSMAKVLLKEATIIGYVRFETSLRIVGTTSMDPN